MRIASFEKWGEWIDAKRDRRPMPEDGLVLAFLEDKDGMRYDLLYHDGEKWDGFTMDIFELDYHGDVLLWMPLPELPEPWGDAE